VNVVLIISNILAGFGAIFRRSLLLLPWILGYLGNILAGFGALFRISLLLLPWILGYLCNILVRFRAIRHETEKSAKLFIAITV